MQECDVCGLMFDGSDRCPGCGSLSSHVVRQDGDQTVGTLPGAEALDEVLSDLEGWGAEPPKEDSQPLPFGYASKPVEVEINLPFGFGAHGDLQTEQLNGEEQGAMTDSGMAAMPEPSQEPSAPPESESDTDSQTAVRAEESTSPSETLPQETGIIALGAAPSLNSDQSSVDDPWAESIPDLPVLEARSSKSSADNPPDSAIESAIFSPSDATENEASSNAIMTASPTPEARESVAQREVTYATDEDTVYHDFGDDFETSEVVVDFDDLMDPASEGDMFDPSDLGESPELMPARVLPLSDVDDSTLRANVDAAFDALVDGSWLAAAELFRAVCEARPSDAAALNDHGLALLQKALEDDAASPSPDPAEEPYFQAAILTLRQAALADRRNAVIMHNLATALGSAGRHETARPIFRAALTLAPDDVGAMNNLAASSMALGDAESARGLLQRAAGLDPECGPVMANLSRLSGL